MRPLLLTYALLCGADAASTHVMLNRGGQELWLPTQNPWAIDAIVGGQAVAAGLMLSWLDKHEHPKAARIIGWSIVGVRAVVVAHNLGQFAH